MVVASSMQGLKPLSNCEVITRLPPLITACWYFTTREYSCQSPIHSNQKIHNRHKHVFLLRFFTDIIRNIHADFFNGFKRCKKFLGVLCADFPKKELIFCIFYILPRMYLNCARIVKIIICFLSFCNTDFRSFLNPEKILTIQP